MGKTLVTGGAGFLGSHVARALTDRGDDLRLTVRESTTRTRPPPLPSRSSSAAACGAEPQVPGVAADMWVETMSGSSARSQ